jgi:hypothetical protein
MRQGDSDRDIARAAAPGASRSSMAAASSPAGIATGSPTQSAREDAGGRARRRVERIRERLGWEPGILNGLGPNPKGMRWRTFHRLIEEHDRPVNRSLHALALERAFLDRGRP